MLSMVNSVSFVGIDVHNIVVEVTVNKRGLPSFDIVGLPGKSIDESRYRVRAAILNSGFDFPNAKIVVNLSPSSIHKEGTHYDLAIATGILGASLGINIPKTALLMGELSLNGVVQDVKGVFITSLFCSDISISELYFPATCVNELYNGTSAKCFPVKSLRDLINHLKRINTITPTKVQDIINDDLRLIDSKHLDFSEIVSQKYAKRILEISAVGGHNVILTGPPGSGKSMLAKAYTTILPFLTSEESLEIHKIYSLMSPNKELNYQFRPYRSPHHTITHVAMIGGGLPVKPGEITLAHNGVLFLDEFCEFSHLVIESLRQPLEDGFVHITRLNSSIILPAKFTLLAACNPCPCGYFGHKTIPCMCNTTQIQKYKSKISGPILDRIDLHATVSAVDTSCLLASTVSSDSSTTIRARVAEARGFSRDRFGGGGFCLNSAMTKDLVDSHCKLSSDSIKLLDCYMKKKPLSARSFYKVLKISRTIADMDLCSSIKSDHLLEALQYRNDR